MLTAPLPRLGSIPLATTIALLAIVGSTHATIVRFDTVEGSFDVQLYDTIMPNTVVNFLGYVNSDRLDGTVVHRNSDTQGRDFVIQGGGFTLHDPEPPSTTIYYSNVETDTPINDEPGGGVAGPSNLRGTIAMAKSGPNTVTSQWFINQGDNSFLDDPNRGDGGFSAFGEVLGNGMVVVDAIGDLPLPNDFGITISSPFNDLPLRNFSGSSINDIRVANTVTINSVSVLNPLPGDFDLNGTVNSADLAIWTAAVGTSSGAMFDDGDADLDGDVDGADLLIWQTGYGAAASTLAITAIPEPGTIGLAMLGAILTASIRRRIA
jgi:peptidyl-prolyl cis-trans isomerase A (cyclophilin A)